MGKQIRRTITITLTETWTFVWAQTDAAPEPTMTVVQAPPTGQPKEVLDAALPRPISPLAPANPKPPPTPDSSRKPKRSRRRRKKAVTAVKQPITIDQS